MPIQNASRWSQAGLRGSGLLKMLVVVAVIGAVALGWMWTSEKTAHQADAEKITQVTQELEKLRAQNTELQRVAGDPATKERQRKDSEELITLRGEVRQLREDKKQLDKTRAENAALREASQQLRQVQVENNQLRNQAQQAQQAQVQAQQMVASSVGASQRNACIANLKQIDGATQQWALEHRLTAESPVVPAGIVEYLKGRMFPVCPAGGTYSVTTVRQPPTCSVPGHSL